MDRVYHLLQGLRPEFEGIRSLLQGLDDAVSQLINEESRLQEQKGQVRALLLQLPIRKQ